MQNEEHETKQTTCEEDHSLKTHIAQDQAKAISELEGLKKRIDECPSDRVKEVLRDSLNKENNTAESDG